MFELLTGTKLIVVFLEERLFYSKGLMPIFEITNAQKVNNYNFVALTLQSSNFEPG